MSAHTPFARLRAAVARSSLLVACAALGAGCSVPVFTEPVTITTRHLPSFSEQVDAAPVVSGRSCSRMTLLVIPLGYATSNAAFNDALSQASGADTLVDWHMKQDVLAIVGSLIYFQNCIVVEGKAVNSAELVARADEPREARAFVEHWHRQRELAEAASSREAQASAGGGSVTHVGRSF